MTDRRPVFELRTGAYTTWRRIENTLHYATDLFVPHALADVTAARHVHVTVNPQTVDEPCLLVNGRWPGADETERIAALPRGHALCQADGQVIAAHLDGTDVRAFVDGDYAQLPAKVETQRLAHDLLIDRPWHLLDGVASLLTADLNDIDLPEGRDDLPVGARIVGDEIVRLAPDATVLPGMVIDAQHGPVAIDHGARVEPFAVLEGPCYVGPRSHIAAHTALRAGTSIGPDCKVGGEVKRAIIQGATNKAHSGYLGDAIVGQWVNLGADTNVSNLKNTYGPVRVQLESDDAPEDTARANHGPIIGDFVRTAIGSRLLTGSVVGTGSMLALSSFAPKHVPRFAFCTDQGMHAHARDALLTTARRMMQHKDATLSEAEAQRLKQLHTEHTARFA